MQQKNNNNLKLLIFGFLVIIVIFIMGSFSSSALSFDYDINSSKFKDLRSQWDNYVIFEDNNTGRLWIYGTDDFKTSEGDVFTASGNYYNAYTTDGVDWRSFGMPLRFNITDPNIVIKDASKPIYKYNGEVFFYQVMTGQMGDAMSMTQTATMKTIAITGCLVLSLMLLPVLLKRLLIFL